ncbi:MAG TPA: DUF2334 domain-containing protein [Solirubrobacteraceae bacterium]|jgi:hypothetical protein
MADWRWSPRRRLARGPREREELRSARLLFGSELAAGRLEPAALRARAVRSAVRSRPIPPRPWRIAQQVARRRGRLDYERAVVDPLQSARRAVLGDAAASPPRFLVRVDEFPHYLAWDDPARYGSDGFRRFHAILAGAGVPYLVAVPPRVSRAPLNPAERRWRAFDESERALLAELRASDGVAFALHGRDHRTRFDSPRRRSELCGLNPSATAALLDQALVELAQLGVVPAVFVPPFNRFDAGQYSELARRFAVVCGGPESIGLLGFHRSPLWLGDAVYLPSYFPFYGPAAEVRAAAARLIERDAGLWTPIALHWGWEADAGWSELEALVASIAPYAARWEDFLDAVKASADDGRKE